ncbi:uncharacterized protein LOC135482262 isoform X2 [Liolophura sinensis]|uniref:uncharacterized protein LOC135482262 isoform X2 n=1 Tax=Liolophura sinensis TaxID=3198878 RepID=UPI0031593503
MSSDLSVTVALLLRAVHTQDHHPQVRRHRHSYLPSNYWGKPNDVAPSVKPNISFIREDLQGLYLPANKSHGNDANDVNDTRQSTSVPPNSPGVLGNHQARIAKTRKGITMSQPLAVLKETQHCTQQETWNSSQNLSEDVGKSGRRLRLEAGHRSNTFSKTDSSERHLSQRLNPWAPGDGREDNDMSNNKIQQQVTIHIPGQDGSQGHVTVKKLNYGGDVLPPLVSIHSSVSTSRNPLSKDNHFLYHHTLGDQQPNLPHSDSNLSNASVALSKSPPFHVLSVDRNGRNDLVASPVDPSRSSRLYTGHVKPKRSKPKVPDSKTTYGQSSSDQYQNLESFGIVSTNGDSNDNPPGVLSESDYSSVSASPGPSLEDTGAFSDAWEEESLTEAVNTLVQYSPVPAPPVKIPTMTQVVQRFKPLKKPKVVRSCDSNINIHRQAYLAALSVARSHQMPKDLSLLSRRFTRPFEFSYFRHIPHQKPCRCVECREQRISNSVTPRKVKAKKLSPMKAIFGNVRVEDYYPRRPVA